MVEVSGDVRFLSVCLSPSLSPFGFCILFLLPILLNVAFSSQSVLLFFLPSSEFVCVGCFFTQLFPPTTELLNVLMLFSICLFSNLSYLFFSSLFHSSFPLNVTFDLSFSCLLLLLILLVSSHTQNQTLVSICLSLTFFAFSFFSTVCSPRQDAVKLLSFLPPSPLSIQVIFYSSSLSSPPLTSPRQ